MRPIAARPFYVSDGCRFYVCAWCQGIHVTKECGVIAPPCQQLIIAEAACCPNCQRSGVVFRQLVVGGVFFLCSNCSWRIRGGAL